MINNLKKQSDCFFNSFPIEGSHIHNNPKELSLWERFKKIIFKK